MRNILYAISCAFFSLSLAAQTTIFTEDFDSGTAAWTFTGEWATTTTQAFNGANSLTDSPSGLYLNNQTTTASINQSFDLSNALDANIYFQMKYDIENGFDYCYVDVSANNGSTWTTTYTINGENNLSNWIPVTVNIGGFVGNTQVKVRWRMFTDQAYQSDGIYIDSLRIVSDSVDNSPPLILHDALDHYEGTFGVNEKVFTITDISGVETAELYYNVDGGVFSVLIASDTVGDEYTYEIPPQEAGAYIDYFILAVDSSTQSNTITSETFKYVSGNYLKYEEGVIDFIQNFSNTGFYTGAAMRMTIEDPTTITTALIGNYTDINNPNDSMEFHVWADNNGEPGADLITPIMVYPAANLQTPYLITRIDLRPYAAELDSLSGDVHIGFIATDSNVWVTVTDTTVAGGDRVMRYNGTTWTSTPDYYQFRIITDTAAPIADFSWDGTNDPTIDFTDETANFPTAWEWDFGDGNTSFDQNPSHTYASPGNYSACLKASNTAGEDSICKTVIVNVGAPIANFNFDPNNDPEIDFFDASSNLPTSWAWDFGDGNGDIIANPAHTYGDTGTYQVCLTVSNAFGSDDTCKSVSVENRAPIALYTFVITDSTVVFTDLSGFSPIQWSWDFDYNGETSSVQNPTFTYPNANATYNVCLTASNQYGSSQPYCTDVEIDKTLGVKDVIENSISIYPNPTGDILTIELDKLGAESRFNIIDMQGRKVRSAMLNSTRTEINLSQIKPGVYQMEVSNGNTVKSFSVVKM